MRERECHANSGTISATSMRNASLRGTKGGKYHPRNPTVRELHPLRLHGKNDTDATLSEQGPGIVPSSGGAPLPNHGLRTKLK